MNSSSSLSLSSQNRRSKPLIIAVTLCCALSSVSMSLLHWGPQNWIQGPSCGLSSAEYSIFCMQQGTQRKTKDTLETDFRYSVKK